MTYIIGLILVIVLYKLLSYPVYGRLSWTGGARKVWMYETRGIFDLWRSHWKFQFNTEEEAKAALFKKYGVIPCEPPCFDDMGWDRSSGAW